MITFPSGRMIMFQQDVYLTPGGTDCNIYGCKSFQKINDIYGHREGDMALVGISEKLKRFSGTKTSFQNRGDEFLAIMRIKAHEESAHIIDRLNRDFNRIFYTSPDGRIQLSISHGIAMGFLKQIESLINEADRLMYIKKLQY